MSYLGNQTDMKGYLILLGIPYRHRMSSYETCSITSPNEHLSWPSRSPDPVSGASRGTRACTCTLDIHHTGLKWQLVLPRAQVRVGRCSWEAERRLQASGVIDWEELTTNAICKDAIHETLISESFSLHAYAKIVEFCL